MGQNQKGILRVRHQEQHVRLTGLQGAKTQEQHGCTTSICIHQYVYLNTYDINLALNVLPLCKYASFDLGAAGY